MTRATVKKILTIVGARPQFIKAAVLSRLLRETPGCAELLLHTGQHYDDAMSAAFFRDLEIPEPEVNLEVGSGPHGKQTARMLEGIEAVLLAERPDLVLVYGDTNSTLAGALAAVKLHLPVAHVEAGLRSHNWQMPEEVNRVLTDRVSTLLFCPSEQAAENLRAEGLTQGVRVVGDIMQDAVRRYRDRALRETNLLRDQGLSPGEYLLATIHRAENTDAPARLNALLQCLGQAALPVLFPVHPRTRKAMAEAGVNAPSQVRLLSPLGYLEMLAAEAGARAIVTDSGGVQKEAYWLGIPCLTVREETEWVETVAAGWNRIVGADPARVTAALQEVCDGSWPTAEARAKYRPLYGDGHAGERMRDLLLEFLQR